MAKLKRERDSQVKERDLVLTPEMKACGVDTFGAVVGCYGSYGRGGTV